MRTIKTIIGVKTQRFVTFVALLTIANICSAQQNVFLTEIVHSSLPGGDVQINIISDDNLTKPGSFSTDKPARIALDFFGAKRDLSQNLLKINSGKVQSVVAVETPDRTRVIVNLTDSARYEVSETINGYAITVFNDSSISSHVSVPKPFSRRPDIAPETTVTNIDFRRSPSGGGSLIIDMSDDKATVDTRARDSDIIIDLLNVNLPAELERRLDVVDFATPVQSIDSFQSSSNVRLVVIPKGKQQHISFQSGNRFTLTVDPIIESESEKLNAEDAALGYEGERLSINFQNIDIRSALTVIADFTGINFVTSDSVQGEITVNLKDVPWDQALDVIMTSKGLSKRQTGNVIWVAPSGEIAAVDAQELAAAELLEEKAPLVSEIIRVNYAKADELADVINSVNVLGGGRNNQIETDRNTLLTARGSVTVDLRTNSLLVQDVAPKISELRKVIADLDKPVRQVLIETRIVQANDNFSRELGARLGFQAIDNSGDDTSIIGGSREGNTTLQNSNVDNINANNEEEGSGEGLLFDNLGVDLGANAVNGSSAAAFAVDLFRSGSSFSSLISLELSALEADGRGKIVASPKLITTNQQEASISQGMEVFVPVEGGDDASGSLEVIEAELQLIVTPQITPDDRIILDVEINQDSLAGTGITTTVDTTQIETQILADNGETVVIGGIYSENVNETITKVPLLGDIPYLRSLFRQKSVTNDRTELLIFLTPKIISPKLKLG